MDAIAGQKVATEQLVRQESQKAPVVKYFPICNISEMQQLENKITCDNRDVYETAISSILQFNLKNITLVIRSDVINAINVDGSHGKVGLKSFKNFYHTLTGAIAKLPLKGLTPEESLRKALQFEKSKYLKKIYRQKTKMIL
ncbi:uncharacterized protein LOC118741632 [Rhagoletis pomonella]|uniref:uncharacterized protein LOC118741632 n=1 Tax=Rhagoletis pomonella TaxID=28610 RepID=UPI001782F69C|nr:uncharacterized protein LOC118741632 [Rhagoletis pomonella]